MPNNPDTQNTPEQPEDGERLRIARLGWAKEAMPVGCDLCGWRGKRIKARSAPCPSCGNGKVQFR